MNDKALLIALGFNPKEGAVGVLTKKYQQADGYRWNKLTKGSGVFDEWAKPYNFEIKKFTKDNLRELTEVEGQSLFNKFAIILRKHSVSDKPNAFNKIFNLFLAKLYDEQKKQTDELEFHWRDDDNPVDFQVRLFSLHKEGLRAFLEKELAGIYDSDFEGVKSREELLAKKKKVRIERKWDNVEFSRIATITRGVTYSKSDQQLEPTENIVLTADNITLDGHFEVKKEVFLYADFNVSAEKRLKRNDIFMCFSSGSKAHLGKVAFIENDTHYLAGGFTGIIRAKENILPKYLFQLLNSILRQSIRDLGAGSNINNLPSVINDIQIPLPPLEIQQKIVSEIEKIEAQVAEMQKNIENNAILKNAVLTQYL